MKSTLSVLRVFSLRAYQRISKTDSALLFSSTVLSRAKTQSMKVRIDLLSVLSDLPAVQMLTWLPCGGHFLHHGCSPPVDACPAPAG